MSGAVQMALTELETIRLRHTAAGVPHSPFVLAAALPEYQEAFQDHGRLVPPAPPEQTAALLRRRPQAMRDALRAALDQWLILARQRKASESAWIELVLALADPDPWRQQVRAAPQRPPAQARELLRKLAREVDAASQPPEALFVLELALRQHGDHEAAVALLRRAQEIFPGDFWINLDLGLALQNCQPPRRQEAIRFLTAAVAIRPDSPEARLKLGNALADARK